MTWPRVMEPALAAHGEAVLWRAGIEALGYPPTWAHTAKEVIQVVQSVQLV